MKSKSLVALASCAAAAAQAQVPPAVPSRSSLEPAVVSATRALAPATTLRDAVTIGREELDASGALSLGEVLQRRAGAELRSFGGAGQPQVVFLRGATVPPLLLVDGLRVGSGSLSAASLEHIPLELIERIEVIRGPMSAVYGPDAEGGVIHVFTRGKPVPYFFAAGAYGTDSDARGSVGLSSTDGNAHLSLALGARDVDARSATNPAAGAAYDPDRDPYRNGFANVRASYRMWQGETLEIDAFTSRSRVHSDAGRAVDDRGDRAISGARFSSSSQFMPWWHSRLAVGEGRDRMTLGAGVPSFVEAREGEASWVNEFASPGASLVVGAETTRRRVSAHDDARFARDRLDTNSAFATLAQEIAGQRFEGAVRRDRDDASGERNTGAASYGFDWPGLVRLAATYGHAYRAPTLIELYGPSLAGFAPNPQLRPERSRHAELSAQGLAPGPFQWKATAFDNRIEDLIVIDAASGMPVNAGRARLRGVEARIEAAWLAVRWSAAATVQRARDEDRGLQIPGRAERLGTVRGIYARGAWTADVAVTASGRRSESAVAGTGLGGFAVLDARVRYAIDKRWSLDVAATNLADRRYQDATGYDAPRRAVLLSVRFESY